MADATEQEAEKLLDVVNDSARTVSARLVTFLTVGVYIAITVASTTDEKLVRGSLVTLPLFNVAIPISGGFGFYMVAPWLILVLHLDLLVQLSVLDFKIGRFQKALRPGHPEWLGERVATYHYVQFLREGTAGPFGRVRLGTAFFGSMIAMPLALLCLTEIRSLPLHDSDLSWSQGLALSADVVAIVVLLWPLLARRDARVGGERPATARMHAALSLRTAMVLACLSVWGLSLRAFTQARAGVPSAWYKTNLRLQAEVLTEEPLEPDTINALKDGNVHEIAEKLARVSQSHALQGRDMRRADFYTAVLPKVDLRSLKFEEGWKYTRLGNANLSWTQMQQAQFADTDMRGAKLQGAGLQGASMPRAKLAHADLDGALLQEADLSNAQLSWAELPAAQLQGANLENANLFGAMLRDANLQGANLHGARLKLADLTGANLEGADLSGANFAGALLLGAHLDGSIVSRGALKKADLGDPSLKAADPFAANSQPLDGCYGRCCPGHPRQRCSGSELARKLPLDRLMDLACDDPYIARGLSAQALRAEDPERSRFGAELVRKRELLAPSAKDRPSHEDCPGVRFLPDATLKRLREHATPGAAVVTVEVASPP